MTSQPNPDGTSKVRRVAVTRATIERIGRVAVVRFFDADNQPCGSATIEPVAKSRSMRSLLDEAFAMYRRLVERDGWGRLPVPGPSLTYSWTR